MGLTYFEACRNTTLTEYLVNIIISKMRYLKLRLGDNRINSLLSFTQTSYI